MRPRVWIVLALGGCSLPGGQVDGGDEGTAGGSTTSAGSTASSSVGTSEGASGESTSSAGSEECDVSGAGSRLSLAWSLHWRADDDPFRWDVARDVAFAPDGSIAVVGSTSPNDDSDDRSDAVVILVSPQGELIWQDLYQGAGHFADHATSVSVAEDGTTFVTVIEETAVVHDREGTQSDVTVVLLAYGPDGTRAWTREVEAYPDPAGEWISEARAVVLSSGEVVVSVPHWLDGDGSEGVLLALVDRWGNEVDRAIHTVDIEFLTLGDAFALGDGFGVLATKVGGGQVQVASFAPDLSLRWSAELSERDLEPSGAAATPDGGVSFVGTYQGRIQGDWRRLATRWGADGQVEWTQDELEDEPWLRGFAIDCAGTIAVAGESPKNGGSGARTRLLSPEGNLLADHLWFTGNRFPTTYPFSVSIAPGGDIVVVGMDHQDATQYDLWIERLTR